jgi:hypothetical protein
LERQLAVVNIASSACIRFLTLHHKFVTSSRSFYHFQWDSSFVL